jgi:pimeloyl-ACP methyl ester carboxylesterase
MKWARLVLTVSLPALLVGGYIILQSATVPPAYAPTSTSAPPAPNAPPPRYAPPVSVPLDEEAKKTMEERGDKLTRELREMRNVGVPDALLVDIEVYRKAALWVLRHKEFYHKDAPAWTLKALDRGLLRASQQARGESPWLQQTGQAVVRGYRSQLDDSIQPYAVTFPADYGKDKQKKWRVDVVLHGCDPSLTEVSFLHKFRGDSPAPKDQDWVQLDLFGRGNNGYRWAGEADVIEAIDHFLNVEKQLNRDRLLDPTRVILRGFSMGGAGTWHLGLHRPERWCVIGPGAGFTTTHGYVKDLLEKLPPEQEACLHIYDAVDYAENAFNVPVVAYAGADDEQLQAARNIQERLKAFSIPMTFLVAPGVGHQFPPEWQKKAEAEYAKHLAKGRPEYPRRVRFVTWTLKYPGTDWVEIVTLDQHYQRALVDAEQTEEGYTIKTANVRALHLSLGPGSTRQSIALTIDGQKVEAQPYLPNPASVSLHVYLEKREGRWSSVLPERLVMDHVRHPQKTAGFQGPIDDAFTGPFLCVRPRAEGWHEATSRYAEASLERFREEWSRYFRGELLVKDDSEVTPQDIASKHLVLFGDPSSNSLIEQVLPGLPLKWTKENIMWEGKEYPTATHLPALIYPSPLASGRYVVLNTGHTFHAADFQDTNARLYPRWGDFALLKVTGGKDPLGVDVVRSGLFDEFWRTPSR